MENPDMKATHLGADRRKRCHLPFHPMWHTGQWRFFASAGIPPFKLMDRVGLDVVLAIEEHYASVRAAVPEGPRKLLQEYIDRGWLGVKSGHGFYEYRG